MEMKQSLRGLVLRVLQELNIKLYWFQEVLAAWWSESDQHLSDLSWERGQVWH